MLRPLQVLLSLLVAVSLLGQVPPPAVPSPAGGAPDRARESYIIESLRNSYRFEKDGTGRHEIYARIRVESESGVEQWGQLVVGYNSANERVEIPFVRVLKLDGSQVVAPAESVQDLSIPLEREAPVYTDYRQKHVTVPGLRPGEELEYDFLTTTHTPLAPGEFWMEHEFLKTGIVLKEELVVDIPRERAIKLKTAPGRDPEIREENGRRIYRWTSSHAEKEEEKSKDKDKEKAAKPGKQPEPPAVEMTTFSSWEAMGRWYRDLERDREQPTAEIRAKAQELTRSKTTDLEKIQALYDYVGPNFRYISLSFGVGRFQPHAAAEVLHNAYGDCKDKHTLLAALLAALGYRASAVLIHSSRKLDSDMPSPSQFDHVFTLVPVGRDEIWMDTTTEVAPFRLLAAVLRKKQALVIPQDGPAHLEETPADPPMRNRQVSEINGQLNELGKLTAQVHYQLRGDTELYMRMLFRHVPPNKWNEWVEQINSVSGLSGQVSDLHISDPAETHEPFQLDYKIEVSGFLDWSKKKSELTLPLSQISMADADEAANEPVEIGSPVEYLYRLRLEFPAEYQERAPLPFSMKRDYADYQASYRVEGKVFTAERRLVTALDELPASRTSDYLAFRRAVTADAEQHLAIDRSAARPPTVSPDLKGDDLYEAAKASFDRGNYKGALELFQKLVAADPKHKSAWMDLGRTQMALRQTQDAIAAFQKQVALNPYDEYAYNALGWAYTTQRSYPEAAAAFDKAIEINPLSEYAHAALGSMYAESHQYEKAVVELEKAVALKSDDSALEISLGDAYLNLGQEDKALAAFDRATQLSPTPEVWNNIAYQLSLKKAHLDRAQQYAESAVTAISNSLRNLSLEQLSEHDFQMVSELDADWDTLGWVYFDRGDLEKAEKYVNAAWRLGQHGEVGDHLAQIYEKRGRRQDAIRTYAMALSGLRPALETKSRLAGLVGGEANVPQLVERNRVELETLRRVKLRKPPAATGTADFFVIVVTVPGGSRIEAAKFVSGDETLKPLGEALRNTAVDFSFPDEVPTKIVRRGTLSCPNNSSQCEFLMMLPEDVHSID